MRWASTTICIGAVVGLGACHTPGLGDSSAEPSATRPPFPDTWTGIWTGTCRATKPDGSENEFHMELHIARQPASNRYSWQLVYGEGEKRQIRDYELHFVDQKAGHYLIDEKNSISIDAWLVGATLHSCFAVGDALIVAEYTKAGAAILFNLDSYQMDSPEVTGGKEQIPEVSAYPLVVSQHARLSKSEK